MNAIEKRLSKAKASLILEHPFIGNIALNMPFILTEDDSVPTAATDGKQIIFNNKFIEQQSDEELKFVVAHECMHPMLEHNFRRNNRDHRRWNMAADYVINQLLHDEGIGRMPSVGLLDPALYQAGKGTSDGIYKLLPENCEGEPLDDCRDGDGDPAEQAQQQAEWKVRVAQAAQAAKMMGKLSAGLSRLVGDILQPKVDWREVLQRFIVRCKTDQRTFARFNRRFIPQGLYLPTTTGESLGELVFAVDCSGSIDEHTINQFAVEIRNVKDDLNPARVHVLYFDSEVSHVESYGPDDALEIKPHGGGGTAFSPVFRYIAEHNIEPVACIFLTDLCCDDFGDAPQYPVLWVSTDKGSAPFGEVVVM